MDNPETVPTLDTQDTGLRQTKSQNHNTIQKTKKMSNTDPIKTTRGEIRWSRRVNSSVPVDIRHPSRYSTSPVKIL